MFGERKVDEARNKERADATIQATSAFFDEEINKIWDGSESLTKEEFLTKVHEDDSLIAGMLATGMMTVLIGSL